MRLRLPSNKFPFGFRLTSVCLPTGSRLASVYLPFTFRLPSVYLPTGSRLASVCFSDVMGNIQKTSDAPQSEHIACKSFSKRVGKRRLERPTPTSRT